MMDTADGADTVMVVRSNRSNESGNTEFDLLDAEEAKSIEDLLDADEAYPIDTILKNANCPS